MGGYSAIRNGLKYNTRFAGIIALSAALIPYKIANASPDFTHNSMRQPYFQSVFGDLTKLLGSDKDPEELIKQLAAADKQLPHMYLSCGTEDFLYDVNLRYHQFLLSEAIEHTYKEKPGDHTWEFWDEGIEDALNWISALPSTKE